MDFRTVPYFYEYLTKIRMSEGFFADRIVRDKRVEASSANLPTCPHPITGISLNSVLRKSTFDTINQYLDDQTQIQKIVSVNPYVEQFTVYNSMGRRLDNNSYSEKTVQDYLSEVIKNRENLEVSDPETLHGQSGISL